MRGRPGKLFSDSLFCNCPNGLLSSVERRESVESRQERDVQSFTLGLTHTDVQRGSLRWKCEGGTTQAAGAHLSGRESSEEAWMSHQSRRQKNKTIFKPHDMGE